jgi:hypothetical protein
MASEGTMIGYKKPRAISPQCRFLGAVREPRMTAVGEIASCEFATAGKPHEERQPA